MRLKKKNSINPVCPLYLGMESFASTTARGEEINNNKFIPSIRKGFHQILCRSHLSHVWLQPLFPPPLCLPNSKASLLSPSKKKNIGINSPRLFKIKIKHNHQKLNTKHNHQKLNTKENELKSEELQSWRIIKSHKIHKIQSSQLYYFSLI